MIWRLFRGASVTLVLVCAGLWGVWRLVCLRVAYVDRCAVAASIAAMEGSA